LFYNGLIFFPLLMIIYRFVCVVERFPLPTDKPFILLSPNLRFKQIDKT